MGVGSAGIILGSVGGGDCGSNKLNFDLLTPSLASQGVGVGVCRQNIYDQVAVFLILLNLIRNLTMF